MTRAPNIALRLAAVAVGIPIIWLSREFSRQPLDVFLTVVFYAAPSVAIAICPNSWERFQIGVGIGYSLSMIVALEIYLRARSGALLMPTASPTPPPPVVAYRAATCLYSVLLLTSTAVLIWRRKRLGDIFTVTVSFVGGLVYPLAAFVVIAVLDQV